MGKQAATAAKDEQTFIGKLNVSGDISGHKCTFSKVFNFQWNIPSGEINQQPMITSFKFFNLRKSRQKPQTKKGKNDRKCKMTLK